MVVMVSGRPSPQDALPRVTAGTTPWTPQVAHHPSLFYVPYLLTGDLFYMEEVEFWAGWVLGSVDPAYRQNAKGLLAVAGNEVRGISWSLRTIGEAATILPDKAPLKSYFVEKLKNNLDWLNEHYTRNHNPEESPVIAVIPKPDDPQTMAPWQQDYLMMAVGQLNEMQVPGSGELEAWLAKFSVGPLDLRRPGVLPPESARLLREDHGRNQALRHIAQGPVQAELARIDDLPDDHH